MNGNQRQEQIDKLADMLHSAVVQAGVLQEASKNAIEQSRAATEAVERATYGLPRSVEAAVERRLVSAAGAAADKMTSTWGEANKAAERAVQSFRMAEGKLSWKLVIMACTSAVVLALIAAGLMAYHAPTVKELRGLRDEREALVADIERLKLEGGGIRLGRCTINGRQKPCVRIDPKSPDFEGGYRLVLVQ